MIPAAGIEDQELPIAAKWAGVNNPTVARGGNLGAGVGCDGESLLGSADAIGGTELADSHPVDRQTQVPASRRERHRRRKAARIPECGEVGARRIFLDRAGLDASLAGGAIESLFELGDEILQIVDLMRQLRSALPLRVERLLGGGLPVLPLVDEHI